MKNADDLIWDGYCQVEVTIDRSAKDVWSYFFGDKKELWSDKKFTTLAGKPGQVGEIYTMEHRGGRFFHKAIKVEPEKLLVLKLTFKKSDEDEEKLVAYEIITLNEVAGRTTVIMQQPFTVSVDPQTDLKLETEKHDRLLEDAFQKLRTVIECRQ